jgi:ParB family chromosome partitioning protein
MNKPSKITAAETGVHTLIPLRQLLKSPRNVRKVPHTNDAIEAYAASFAAKGILQNLVVEPELDEAACPTGRFFVTIGEGRRLGQCLRVERGEITDDEPIPCVIDIVNDPREISLDENVTREAMHPADQFDAFRTLNEQQGMSAEDIAARFGVNVRTVKQRLRLGAVSPRLMQDYRDGKLTLEQLTAFCVSEDHARQESVYDGLTDWQREPYYIRRQMVQGHVNADDRRACFVGVTAYTEAGGHIERDLFTEDGEGRFTDPVLLEKLALDRLTAMAATVREAEGWKWAEAYIDFPYIAGMRRAFPKVVALSAEDAVTLEVAKAEMETLSEAYGDYEFSELPEDIDAKMSSLETEIARLQSLASAFEPDDIARAGMIASLTHDGTVKIERGLIRAEDVPSEPKTTGDVDAVHAEGGDGGDYRDDQDADDDSGDDIVVAPSPKLADGLVRDLTAHRTVALRLALGEQPEIAARALAHLLVLDTFYDDRSVSCLEIRPVSTDLAGWMEDYAQSSAVEALQVRHDAWAERLPQPDALWPYLVALEAEDLGLLIAHCVGLTVNVVRQPFGIRSAEAFAEDLATSLSLDMGAHWRPTARRYFSRVTKGHIVDAVREAVSDEAADRISKLKKPEMAEAAEHLIAPTGWLQPLMRVARSEPEPSNVTYLSDHKA